MGAIPGCSVPDEPAPPRPGAALVREMVARGALNDPAWRAAFAEVPRHLFVPYYFVSRARRATSGSGARTPTRPGGPRWLHGAYADEALATRVRDGELVSSSSQPSLMARMLEELEMRGRHDRPGDRRGHRLQRGAALPPARRRRGDHHRPRPGDHGVRPQTSRGGRLPARPWSPGTGRGAAPSGRPFDRIIATCTLPSVPQAWLAQCRPGARILAPLATGLIMLRVRETPHGQVRRGALPAHARVLRAAARRRCRAGAPPAHRGTAEAGGRERAVPVHADADRGQLSTRTRPSPCGSARGAPSGRGSGSRSGTGGSGPGWTTRRGRTSGHCPPTCTD